MSEPLHALLQILPAAQKALWPLLRPVSALGFVLYGGTAIALQLGHRTSQDFDFFSEAPLRQEALREALPLLNATRVLQERPDTLTVLAGADQSEAALVKLSFFGVIDHGRVGTPRLTEDGVLQVASLDDLMATKLKVILQRVEAKDYQDIAAMLDAGQSLAYGLASARQLYGRKFQPSKASRQWSTLRAVT